VFTVTIAQTAGDADTGVTTQTVTINEAEPYAPGTLGFSDEAGEVVEGVVYTGTVSRTGGAVGEAGVTLTAPAGYTVDPAARTWAAPWPKWTPSPAKPPRAWRNRPMPWPGFRAWPVNCNM
jgi:hypothetical protein